VKRTRLREARPNTIDYQNLAETIVKTQGIVKEEFNNSPKYFCLSQISVVLCVISVVLALILRKTDVLWLQWGVSIIWLASFIAAIIVFWMTLAEKRKRSG
jgi:uncharacterized membrane protein YdjX (TVP38/TMEM64 family)